MTPRWAMAGLTAVGLASTSPASAEPSRPGAAFGSEVGEAALFVATASTLTARFIPQRKGTWAPSHAAEFDFDTGLVSDFAGAGIGSALQIGAGYGFETAYLASHGDRQPAVGALRTGAIELESLFLSAGFTLVTKNLVGRCRPRAYRHGRCTDEYDAFPSGHTSAVGAFGGARLVTVLRSDPDDDNAGIRWASFAIAETGIVAAGALRVASHAHSWEDVVAGALLGHVAGVLVAVLHPEEPLDVPASATRQRRSRVPTRGEGPGQPLVLGWGGAF